MKKKRKNYNIMKVAERVIKRAFDQKGSLHLFKGELPSDEGTYTEAWYERDTNIVFITLGLVNIALPLTDFMALATRMFKATTKVSKS